MGFIIDSLSGDNTSFKTSEKELLNSMIFKDVDSVN